MKLLQNIEDNFEDLGLGKSIQKAKVLRRGLSHMTSIRPRTGGCEYLNFVFHNLKKKTLSYYQHDFQNYW